VYYSLDVSVLDKNICIDLYRVEDRKYLLRLHYDIVEDILRVMEYNKSL